MIGEILGPYRVLAKLGEGGMGEVYRAQRRAWEFGASAGRQRPPSGASPGAWSAAGGNLRVAVLPFSDLSAARDQEWFCDGIAEELLTTLSQITGLTVAARASAFSFRGRFAAHLRRIGQSDEPPFGAGE